ncbi:hypothetical protein VP1G_00940 [Cytospora mali]|uniref:DUF1771 domain-containing protein n=1 Tax=Cytospora mali TaxID=578113 RepID=A0A194UPS2_CYTMA|nr:hypothetical protein VP1G_00940 [Valsa mali var. pyri (nom. inval.)]
MGDQGIDDTGLLMDRLVNEFRSVLDETVIIAIVGDYDLTQQFDEARGILEALSKDSVTEDAFGFNPIGLDGHADDQAQTESCNSASGSKLYTDFSERTDFSDALSERFESLELPNDVNVSTLDEDGKVSELKIMFPELRELDLRFALKKAAGDFTKTCEELLSTQYLEENGLRPRGIEGAFREDEFVGHRKGRSSADTPKEKAGKAKLEVGYCLKPLDLESEDKAASNPVSPATTPFNPLTRANSLPRSMPSSGTYKRTSPVSDPSANKPTTHWQTVQSKQRKTYSELALDAAAARDTTAQSFAAASQAYRRGKSDALLRPVASVFSERAREQLERSKAVQSESYEALVDEQSSSTSIDLHGVPVADGVRMALERTQIWWDNLGEDRARKARSEGFTVVTGLGIHSSKGVSRMRQDVGAALKRAGWRVRTETGQFVVTGKA